MHALRKVLLSHRQSDGLIRTFSVVLSHLKLLAVCCDQVPVGMSLAVSFTASLWVYHNGSIDPVSLDSCLALQSWLSGVAASKLHHVREL